MAELKVIGLLILLLVAAVGGAAVMTWFERRMLGVWQDRLGPNRVGPFGIVLVAADMLKLLGKNLSDEMVISGTLEGASSGAAAGRSQADLIGYGGPGRTIELQLRLSF